jgi:hypothetical protein
MAQAPLSLQQIINYDNPLNFTFDAVLGEITSVAKLKTLAYADESFHAGYDQGSLDGDRAASGTPTATAYNDAKITNGELDLTSGTIDYVDYNSLTGMPVNVGCLRFDFTPNFTGLPASGMYPFALSNSAGSLLGEIFAEINAGGFILVTIRNSSGGTIGTINASMPAMVAGVKQVIELNWNVVSGSTKLFVDGIQIGATLTATGTRGAAGSCNHIRLGTNAGAFRTPNFKLDNVRVFSAVQNTANHAGDLPYSVASNYDTGGVSFLVNSPIEMDDFIDFDETAVIPANTGIRYQLCDGTSCYWFDRNNSFVISVSDGSYDQSNTETELKANTENDDFSGGISGKVKAILKSDDGWTTPELTSVVLAYSFYKSVEYPSRATIFGYIIDTLNCPVEGAIIKISGDQYFHGDNIVTPNGQVLTNDTGYFEIDVQETTTISQSINFEVSYFDTGLSKIVKKKYSGIVPNADSAALTSFAS